MSLILYTAPCHIHPPELPSGWVSIPHASGATVYFHRESRVCSWGMPYTIKKGLTVKVRLTHTHTHTHTHTQAITVFYPESGGLTTTESWGGHLRS